MKCLENAEAIEHGFLLRADGPGFGNTLNDEIEKNIVLTKRLLLQYLGWWKTFRQSILKKADLERMNIDRLITPYMPSAFYVCPNNF